MSGPHRVETLGGMGTTSCTPSMCLMCLNEKIAELEEALRKGSQFVNQRYLHGGHRNCDCGYCNRLEDWAKEVSDEVPAHADNG